MRFLLGVAVGAAMAKPTLALVGKYASWHVRRKVGDVLLNASQKLVDLSAKVSGRYDQEDK